MRGAQGVFDSNCGYRNCEFMRVLFEDVASDPTLPRTKSVHFAACGHGEVLFFQVNTIMHVFFSWFRVSVSGTALLA